MTNDRTAAGSRGSAVRSWLQIVWTHRLGIFSALSVLLALVVYVFFASAGTWTSWPVPKRYYDDLASAFRAGRLDLNIRPPAALLALSDPYDRTLRTDPELKAFVTTAWDLTLYRGKIYMYWGPVPGVILALVKLIHDTHIADEYLVFAFLGGLLIFSTLLILRLRHTFGGGVPGLLVVAGILVAAFVLPIPWMFNRARVYEAAIGAGQFFLTGGLYFAYLSLDREKPSGLTLILAGACWTLAVGSRLTTILPVAVVAGTTFLWAVKKSAPGDRIRDGARYAALIGLPLLAGLIGLAWYNWARFGSILETGFRYQLTDTNMNLFYPQTFTSNYVAPNLLLYLLNPVAVQSRFPFLAPTVMELPSSLHMGDLRLYHVQNSAGLLYVLPYAVFAIVAVVSGAWRVSGLLRKRPVGPEDDQNNVLSWLTVSLSGMSLISLGAMLAFFYVAVRYLAELTPSLVLLSTLGVWEGYKRLPPTRGVRWLYLLLVVVLALITVAVGILLAFSEDNGTILHHNPQLMRQLIRFFGR